MVVVVIIVIMLMIVMTCYDILLSLLYLVFTITINFSGASPVTEELFASTTGRVTSPECYNRAGDQAVFGIGLFSRNLVYRMCYSDPGLELSRALASALLPPWSLPCCV